MVKAAKPNILIISGCPGAPHRYRCENKKEQLESLGYKLTVKDFYDLDVHTLVGTHDFVILYRVPYNLYLLRIISDCKLEGIPVVFDIDDMVFKPSLAPFASALGTMPLSDVDLYMDGVRRYAKTILHIDRAMVSTPFLERYIGNGIPSTFIVRNVPSLRLIDLSETAIKNNLRKNNSGSIVFGYLSGSPTHDNDLNEICYPLYHLMLNHPPVQLWVMGTVRLPGLLEQFKDRIKTIPFMDWQELPTVCSQMDINLAPLEPDNLHCQAKSAIKFLEAGLVKVPTVASSTGAFKEAINHGSTGFMASSGRDWIEILESLVKDPEKRNQTGSNAYKDILSRFHPSKAGKELEEIILSIIDNSKRKGAPKLTILEKTISYFDPGVIRQVSDRSFRIKTIVRHLKFQKMGISRVSMPAIPLVELRESRTMGQEFLYKKSRLSGFSFPVQTGSDVNIDNLKLEIMVNDQSVQLEHCIFELEPLKESNYTLHVRFNRLTVNPPGKLFIRLLVNDPLDGTGLRFYCDPFVRSLRYRRYHNGIRVLGKLIFKAVSDD